jgi:hypothetical protein
LKYVFTGRKVSISFCPDFVSQALTRYNRFDNRLRPGEGDGLGVLAENVHPFKKCPITQKKGITITVSMSSNERLTVISSFQHSIELVLRIIAQSIQRLVKPRNP